MTMAQQRAYADVAAAYRAAGWAAVLPLAAGSKYPPPSGYTGRAGADPDDEQIATWCAELGRGNIAIRMPDGVVGIDVDHYGDKVGADTLDALERERGPLPDTWTSTSRGAGPSSIRWYRIPKGVELPGVLGPCIEAIQRHHRYAVVAPSIVEGRRYRWYRPDGTISDRPPTPEELPWLPDAWQAWSSPQREPITLERLQPDRAPVDRSRAVQRALDEGLRHMRTAGGRHDHARDHCLALVRLAHAGHPGADDALDQLGWTFRLAIADRAGPRQAEAEWRSMLDGAWTIVQTTPSTRPPWDELVGQRNDPLPLPATQPTTGPQEAAGGDDEREHGWECTDLAAIVSGDYQRPRPGLLRRNT